MSSKGLGLWSIPKKLQVLVAILIAAGVVAATGTLVSQLTPSQEVTGLILTIAPNPAESSVVLGVPYSFTVNVANPSDTDATVHLFFEMSWCGTADAGSAYISFSGTNLCSSGVETGPFNVPANNDVTVGPYSMTFYGATGPYDWVVQAHV